MRQGPSWAPLARSLVEADVAVPAHGRPGVEEGAGPGAALVLGGESRKPANMHREPPPLAPENFTVRKQGSRIYPSEVIFLQPSTTTVPPTGSLECSRRSANTKILSSVALPLSWVTLGQAT